jgi:hypothetical protein
MISILSSSSQSIWLTMTEPGWTIYREMSLIVGMAIEESSQATSRARTYILATPGI